jgi:hypothetical protein
MAVENTFPHHTRDRFAWLDQVLADRVAASNNLADLAARVRAARHADRDNPDEDAVVLR